MVQQLSRSGDQAIRKQQILYLLELFYTAQPTPSIAQLEELSLVCGMTVPVLQQWFTRRHPTNALLPIQSIEIGIWCHTSSTSGDICAEPTTTGLQCLALDRGVVQQVTIPYTSILSMKRSNGVLTLFLTSNSARPQLVCKEDGVNATDITGAGNSCEITSGDPAVEHAILHALSTYAPGLVATLMQ